MAFAYEIARPDEIVLKKVDQVSPYLKYIGRADFGRLNPATSDAVWQIIRVSTVSGVETWEYALKGSYTGVWDSRSTYFSAFTSPVGVEGALTVGATASEIKVGASALADRKMVTLTNNSANTLYWGWTALVTTSSGTPIIAGATVDWSVPEDRATEAVPAIYIIAAGAGNNTRVTESPQSAFDSGSGSTVSISGSVAVTNADLTTIASAVHTEDTNAADGDKGFTVLAVRKDTAISLVDTDGDYERLQMNNAGRLWTSATIDAALPAGSAVIGQVTANAGTNLNTSTLALESGGNLATAVASLSVLDDWDESDRAKVNLIVGQAGVQGGSGTTNALTQRVVLATDVALPTGTNTLGNVKLAAATSGGATTFSLISTGSSGDANNIKSSAGQLFGWTFSNTNASPAYVKVYNSASAPTAGSGTPVLRLIIPGSSTGAGSNIFGDLGLAFSSGIGFTIVTGATDAASTGVAANEVLVNFFYA